MKTYTIEGILSVITNEKGNARLASFIPRQPIDSKWEEEHNTDENLQNAEYNAAIDGIESFVMALAAEGIDIGTEAFHSALHTALEAMGNNL